MKPKPKINVSLNIELSDKQKEIIRDCNSDSYDFIVVKTGRQVGKTTIAQLVGFQWATNMENINIGFFMPTYKQCKNVFLRYKKMFQHLESLNLVKFIGSPDFSIEFSNGSILRFFTADNDNFRGFTFNYLICDEACFIKNDIYHVILPTVAVSLSKKENKGKVLLLSTPKTKNWFYYMCKRDNNRTKVFSFTSEEGGIISKDVLDSIRKSTPDVIFRNEYLGEFMDSGNGLFKYLNCISDIDSSDGFISALDIGSKHDYTVLTIMNKSGGVIHISKYRHQEYDCILKAVIAILKKHKSPVIFIESNGVGQMPFEYMKKNYSSNKSKEWITTQKSKENIIYQLILDFNIKNITIPNDEDLKNELDNFTCDWVNGKPKFSGGNNSPDDMVMSLAICNYNRDKISSGNIKSQVINYNRRGI